MAGWRKTLERNWVYMLAGTLLSVLLWVAVSADTVAQQMIPADLVIINGDRHYVLTEREPETDAVAVVFTGRAGDLVGLSVARPQIFVSIDSVESLDWEVRLRPEMVKGRGGRELIDVRAVSVRPNVLRLHFEPRAQKVVRVAPRVRVTLAAGYTMADSVRAEPGAVAVEGPENAVSRIDSVVTAPVVRDRLRESITVEVPLEQPDARGLVELSSPSVRVTVSVEAVGERVFPGIPVSTLGGGGFRVEPPLVDVRLSGPRSAVESVRPEALSPRIELTDFSDYDGRFPILLPAPGPFLDVVIEPDSARVVKVGGTS